MNKTITLKQYILINKILNKRSAYINELDIKEGDEIEVYWTLTGAIKGDYAYKINLRNIRTCKEKTNVIPHQAWRAFTSSFEYTERI